MLQADQIFEKTEKGLDEVRTRQYKLGGKPRMLLLMVDGKQPVAALREQMESLGLTDAALEALVEEGFLQLSGGSKPAEKPAEVSVAVEGEVSPFIAARKLMNESVFNSLGLKGFFFTLKLEKSSNADDLRALMAEYEELMTKAQGAEVAALIVQRARALLG